MFRNVSIGKSAEGKSLFLRNSANSSTLETTPWGFSGSCVTGSNKSTSSDPKAKAKLQGNFCGFSEYRVEHKVKAQSTGLKWPVCKESLGVVFSQAHLFSPDQISIAFSMGGRLFCGVILGCPAGQPIRMGRPNGRGNFSCWGTYDYETSRDPTKILLKTRWATIKG